MATKKSWLCVGGPMAGRRYATESNSSFRVAVRSPMPMVIGPAAMEEPTAVETVVYIVQRFGTQQGHVSFWVPEKQTTLETITLLLDCYEMNGFPMSRG